MKAIEIVDGIYRIGANIVGDYLFEGIWTIPDGVSLNSYVVVGEKKALIDLVQDYEDIPGVIKKQLESISITIEDFDYIVINHMEPDHSGWLQECHKLNPEAKIIVTKKGAEMIKNFFGITKNIVIVKSGDTLDLGNGKKLLFEEIPNVHWPETMVTYEENSQILFSCDAFGSFGKIEDEIFDDHISDEKHAFFEKETLRYFANIVSSFSKSVQRAIKKLEDLSIKMIAPSHGIIWRENPKVIIERYNKLACYIDGLAEPEITVVWGSMYGNTKKVLRSVVEGIRSENVPVHIFQAPDDDVSYALASAWKSKGIVFGMPTYEYKMFPPIAHVIDMFSRKHIWNRKVFRFGSYGWSGGAQKEFDSMTEKMKWDILEPVEWCGKASEEDHQRAYERGKELARLIKSEK